MAIELSERWMTLDMIHQACEIEDRLLSVWGEYIHTIGPAAVKAYRDGKLHEFAHEDLLARVVGRMEQMAKEALISEELAQDDQKA